MSPFIRDVSSMIAWCKSLLRKLWSKPGSDHAPAQTEDPDAEIREVFLAELGEVTQSLRQACAQWRVNAADQAALKSLRRGFHTIKGSAPLIGAMALADFCRQLEKLTIQLIEKPRPVTADMISTMEHAIGVLPAFANAISDSRPPPMVRAIGYKVQQFLA